jgi:hypothetical protein
MISVLLNKLVPGKIDTIELDCVLHESHTYKNTITDFPVERGYNISDHIIRSPEQVTLEGIISNTPVNKDSVYTGNGDDANPSPVGDRRLAALESLLIVAGYDTPEQQPDSVINLAKIVDIVTGLRVYHSMVLMTLDIPRDAASANILRFTAEFKRITITESGTAKIENTSSLLGRAPNIASQAANTEKAGTVNPIFSGGGQNQKTRSWATKLVGAHNSTRSF